MSFTCLASSVGELSINLACISKVNGQFQWQLKDILRFNASGLSRLSPVRLN